ncbi:MAG: FAD-dependent oxidoreductase, partial [Candidatus Dadabacteria bacterium]|nr:FAD-dependent oxidoreductase [Candidatus Dadabacteria bacterium]
VYNATPRDLRDVVVDGRRLFSIFFKSYTEKVWGMKCSEISADWAAQRIKGLSLLSALKNAFFPGKPSLGGEVIKTLIDSFHYPRKGPGMMWEKAGSEISRYGGNIRMGHRVTGLYRDEYGWDVVAQSQDGTKTHHEADFVISSAPIRELVASIEPAVSQDVAKAAAALSYRDFLVVGLVVKDRNIFDDNWIYIHDPGVKVGRIQNFKSWSPEMVPDSAKNCYGMEYFCFEGDGLWMSKDEDLVKLASDELVRLELARPGDVYEGFVIRQKKAYPVYDDNYVENVQVVRRSIEESYPGLCLVGRNGMHKYNNQDHAMMTAMLTVENIIAGEKVYDVWRVNQDAEYHEEQRDSEKIGRLVPSKT